MKFFNKLSVLSLIVLMFSFMNVANAARCQHSQVSSCDHVNGLPYSDDEKAKICNGYFEATSSNDGHQCKWNNSFAFKTGTEVWSCIAIKDKCSIETASKK